MYVRGCEVQTTWRSKFSPSTLGHYPLNHLARPHCHVLFDMYIFNYKLRKFETHNLIVGLFYIFNILSFCNYVLSLLLIGKMYRNFNTCIQLCWLYEWTLFSSVLFGVSLWTVIQRLLTEHSLVDIDTALVFHSGKWCHVFPIKYDAAFGVKVNASITLKRNSSISLYILALNHLNILTNENQ